jgi:hypothetical protein
MIVTDLKVVSVNRSTIMRSSLKRKIYNAYLGDKRLVSIFLSKLELLTMILEPPSFIFSYYRLNKYHVWKTYVKENVYFTFMTVFIIYAEFFSLHHILYSSRPQYLFTGKKSGEKRIFLSFILLTKGADF